MRVKIQHNNGRGITRTEDVKILNNGAPIAQVLADTNVAAVICVMKDGTQRIFEEVK